MRALQAIPRFFTARSLPRLPHGWGWLIFAAGLLTAYLLINFLAPRLPAEWNVYVLQPLAWLALGGQAWGLTRLGWCQWQKPARRLILFGALIGVLQLLAFLLAGILGGMGYSPLARQLPALIGNLWFLLAGVAGMEAARAALVSRLAGRSPLLAVGLGSLLSLLMLVPPGAWGGLSTPQQAIAAAGGRFLPLLAEGLLASLLAWLGGPLPAIAFRAVGVLFRAISPVLPDVSWLVTAFIGTLVPLFGFIYLQNSLLAGEPSGAPASEPAQTARAATLNHWWWAAVVIVAAFWFTSGLFGIRPFVVSGFSMKPAFVAGDLVLITPIEAQEVRMGDVIQFQRGGSFVVHRVIEIREQDGQRVFITQGDNNNVQDEPVPQSILRGKVAFYLPQIGWPVIGLKQVLQWIF
ncbi:MAG: signal peptidase I [Chloroflexota bacterium]|jgi:signal peptidase